MSTLGCAQTPATVRMEVTGVPAGPRPPMELVLPNGQKVVNPDPAAWTASAPGKYRLTGAPFRVAGQVVDDVMAAAPVEITVKAGDKAVLRLAYGKRPGSGMLLVATARINEDSDDFSKGQIRGLADKELAAGGLNGGSLVITTGPRLGGGAVDGEGNYYYGDGWDATAQMRFTPSVLGAKGKAAKLGEWCPCEVLFAPDGAVWLHEGRKLRQYASAGAPRPQVEIEIAEEDEGLGDQVLFTPAGDLVVYRREKIDLIPAGKLKRSGTLTAADSKARGQFPSGSLIQAALDRAGNFWAADINGAVMMLPAAGIARGGSLKPREFGLEQGQVGLAIDNAGAVWTLNKNSGVLSVLAPGGSSFAPKGNFGRGFDEFTRLTFSPAPEWSPLAAMPGAPKRLAGN